MIDIPGQTAITFAPSDPRVSDIEAPRLNRQCHAILAAFRAAPDHMLTNLQLAEICIRYSARILEIRRAGYVISIIKRDERAGTRLYWMAKDV